MSLTSVVSPGMFLIFFSISVASFLVGDGVTVPPAASSLTSVSGLGFSFTEAASSILHKGAMGEPVTIPANDLEKA